MKIGYLHLSNPSFRRSGVVRYGNFIAEEAGNRSQLQTIAVEVTLTGNFRRDRQSLQEAAQRLKEADIIHLQYNKFTWGGGWRSRTYLQILIRACRQPVAVTIHDVYSETYPNYGLLTAIGCEYEKQQKYDAPLASRLLRTARSVWSDYLADHETLRWLSENVSLIFVCTEEEARRLSHLVDSRKLNVVPHFIEKRLVSFAPDEARRDLGLDRTQVVTLQGFIYGHKGHYLLVDAMKKLPPEVTVVFAGGATPGNETIVSDLLAHAESKEVKNRLRITGYLSDIDLERYLVATHLAVCPFKVFSASSSLSTWISLARPILASALPQIAEYNGLVPGAITTFAPYSATALAAAIQARLATPLADRDDKVAALGDRLSIEKVFDRHLECYQRAFSRG